MKFGSGNTGKDDIHFEVSDNEWEEVEEEEDNWEEFEAVQMIRESDLVVLRSGDEFSPYYLLKITSPPQALDKVTKDSYGHLFHEGQQVIMGHYLEEHKLSGASKFLFEDVSKMAIISTFCVAGICPELPVTETLRQKQTTLYEVTSEVDGILSGLVVGTY